MVFDGLLMVSVAVSVSHKPSLDLGVFPSIFLNFACHPLRLSWSSNQLEAAGTWPRLPIFKGNFAAIFGQLEPPPEEGCRFPESVRKAPQRSKDAALQSQYVRHRSAARVPHPLSPLHNVEARETLKRHPPKPAATFQSHSPFPPNVQC